MAEQADKAQIVWLGFSCPSCHALFRVPVAREGKRVGCPKCGTVVAIPAGRSERTAVSASAPRPSAPPLVRKVRTREAEQEQERPTNQFRKTEEVTDPPEESGSQPEEVERESESVPPEQIVPVEEGEAMGEVRRESSPSAGGETVRRVRKRIKKKPVEGAIEFDWEKEDGESRMMAIASLRPILIGGVAVFILMIVVVVLVLNWQGTEPEKKETKPGARPPIVDEEPVVPELENNDLKAELPKIEAQIMEFLKADSVDEILKLARGDAEVKRRIRDYYGASKPVPLSPRDIAPSGRVLRRHGLWAVDVVLPERTKPIALEKVGDHYLVDWESWVGYSGMSWDAVQKEKPTEPVLFRVLCSKVHYYNFDFKDERKWRSYRLESPEKKHILYGYVPRNSIQESMLTNPGEEDNHPKAYILKIRYPKEVANSRQVIIDEVLEAGWVRGGNEPAPKPAQD